MKKGIIFYTYLPPWRIDIFNEMGKLFDLQIVFLNTSAEGFKYNRNRLSNLLNIKHHFWHRGFKLQGKVFRTGVYKFLSKEKPEVVFSHEYSPTSVLLAILLKFKFLNYQYVITTSDNLSIAAEVRGLKKIARKFVLNNADGLIVYSEPVKQFYKNHFRNINIEICPNIQNPKTLLSYKPLFEKLCIQHIENYNLKGSKVILYAGRLVDVKGLDLLIRAFSKSKNKGYTLVLVGEGNEKGQLIRLVEELALKDRVCMPGFFDGAELYAWYHLASFFVLPSRFEPFGAVVNESLVLGCPVMASKYIGALEFIVEGINGHIFDPLDEPDFINILNHCIMQYSVLDEKRSDLMQLSFVQYINSFKTVLNDEN